MLDCWKRRTLADFLEFRNGMNFTQASQGERVKVIGVGDFKDKEVLNDFSETPSITLNGKVNPDDLLKNDDLLFVRSNGNKALIGRCVLVSGITEPISFSGFTIRGRVKSDEIDHSFASKLVRSPLFKEHLHRMGGGSSINNLSQDTLSEFCFSLPPLPEQRKIAEILRTWDEAIEKLEALRAAKEARYKALAQRFFDPCHPTFHGRPNEWREFELGDVFCERNQSGENNDRLLSITMNGGVIDRDDVGRKDTSTDDKSKYKLILPGDIGYNTMRMWQGVSGLSALRGIISPAYTVVTPVPNQILGGYAAHLFKSRRMVFDFERYSQGLTSDTWNLKFPAFSKIKVFLPPVEDQEKQAELLDALTVEREVIGKQLEALTRQKRGLMQKLLTGEWRVEVSDDEEATA